MSKIWPSSTIRELIALAVSVGESTATLDSAEEARLFRFAIYSFRRNNGVGEGLQVTLFENKVILTRQTCPSISITSPAVSNEEEQP